MGLTKLLKEDALFEKITTSYFTTYMSDLEKLYFSRHLASLPSSVVGIALIALLKKYYKSSNLLDMIMVKFKTEYPKDLFSALLGDPIYHYGYSVGDRTNNFSESGITWKSDLDLKKVYGSNMVMGSSILNRFSGIIDRNNTFFSLIVKHKEIIYKLLEPVSKSSNVIGFPNFVPPMMYYSLFYFGNNGQSSYPLYQDVEFLNKILKYFVVVKNKHSEENGQKIDFIYSFLSSVNRITFEDNYAFVGNPFLTIATPTSSSSRWYNPPLTGHEYFYNTITSNPSYFKKVKDELVNNGDKKARIANIFNDLRISYFDSNYNVNRNPVPKYIAFVRPYGVNYESQVVISSYGEMGQSEVGNMSFYSTESDSTINGKNYFFLMNEFTGFAKNSRYYDRVNNHSYHIVIYEMLK